MLTATRSGAILRGPERGFAPMVGSRQILSHSSAAVRTRSFAASSFVGLAGSSLSNQGASGDSYAFSALDVEHAADLPRHHGLTSRDDGQQEPSRPDDFSHGHTGATSPASGSARLTGGSHTRPANSSLAAHGCYRVIGPARICKRGDTLVAHLFPGARLELLDRDGNATALLLLQQRAAAAVQPQPLTATDATAALPMSYGSGGSSTAVGSMGSAGGSGDSACWSAGASLFSIADDEDVPPPLPASAPAPAPAPMASSPAAATAAAAPPPLAAPPLMSSGVGGGIGGGSSAGGGAFPAAAGSAQAEAEAEAQLVVEECVLVAAHVELGGSASSVDLVDTGLQPALHRYNGHTYLSVRCTATTATPTCPCAAPPQRPHLPVRALHRYNGHTYLSVRCTATTATPTCPCAAPLQRPHLPVRALPAALRPVRAGTQRTSVPPHQYDAAGRHLSLVLPARSRPAAA